MLKEDKERVVAELTEKLRTADTLIVADYRGLTMPQIDALRGRLLEHGAQFNVVKNTLTRRAAEAAGVTALPALLEGPSAIAFIESDGDMVAVAKALADSARDTKVLEIRGGILQGREISGDDILELSKLPPFDVLRGQVLAAIIAPLTQLLALVNAPLQNLVGLIDARIEQLGGATEAEPESPVGDSGPVEAAGEPEGSTADPEAEPEPAAEEVETETAEPVAQAEAPAEETQESESDDQEANDDGGS
jgi:large subunit ribosomal protein L10